MSDHPLYLKTWSCREHPAPANIYVKWDGHRVAHVCIVCEEYAKERTFVDIDDLEQYVALSGQIIKGFVHDQT